MARVDEVEPGHRSVDAATVAWHGREAPTHLTQTAEFDILLVLDAVRGWDEKSVQGCLIGV